MCTYVCMVLLASLGSIPGTEPLRHDKASTEDGDMLQKSAMNVLYACYMLCTCVSIYTSFVQKSCLYMYTHIRTSIALYCFMSMCKRVEELII